MGRPRKTGNQPPPGQHTAYDDCDDDLGATTDPNSGSGHLNRSGDVSSVSRGSATTTTTITTPSSVDDSTTRQAAVDVWDTGRIDPVVTQTMPASRTPNTFTQTLLNPLEPSWLNPLPTPQTNDETLLTASSVDHEYITILNTLATLEQSVSMGPPTPSVELVFKAERDFRTLKDRIFANHDPPIRTSRNPRALLTLSLLSERVVSILEGKFRSTISTVSSRTMGSDGPGTLQDYELPWIASFATGEQQAAVATTTRRVERSFRGFIDQPCVFPVPGGKSAIRFGTHELSMPATARAIKAILQIRLRKMVAALLDMQAELARQDRAQVDYAHGLLDRGGSDAILRATAADVVQNLVERLQGLQGAMVLVG